MWYRVAKSSIKYYVRYRLCDASFKTIFFISPIIFNNNKIRILFTPTVVAHMLVTEFFSRAILVYSQTSIIRASVIRGPRLSAVFEAKT